MQNVSLSSSVRQNLLSLQSTAEMMSQTQNRLATGKKVNSALDNATNFFTSASLSGRATDLRGLLDGISNATQTLKAADTGISAITKLVQSAQAIVRSAQADTAGTNNATFAAQYTEILSQIDKVATDSSYNGVNLIDSATADALKVVFNELSGASQNDLGIDAVDMSSTGLSIQAALGATAATYTSALDSLGTALNTLRTNSAKLGANMAIIQARQDFTKSSISNLTVGSDNLVNADTNEEAATLLALQTRQQLSQSALSMANQQDQAVLRLFS